MASRAVRSGGSGEGGWGNGQRGGSGLALAETEGFEPSMRFWHILP